MKLFMKVIVKALNPLRILLFIIIFTKLQFFIKNNSKLSIILIIRRKIKK